MIGLAAFPKTGSAPAWAIPASPAGSEIGAENDVGDAAIRPQPSLRILVVEDEILTADYLEHLLVELGHEVCGHATSVAAALRLADLHRPDLVLMDVNLGRGGDGIEAAKQILAQFSIRSLFVTAYGDRVTLGRVQSVGPAGIVLKPFDKQRLGDAIAGALGGSN
jgi:DNA-binding NarL/FixJ family response regulator